jgi:hypothetical protein
MSRWKNTLIRGSVQAFLRAAAALARPPALESVSRACMRALAWTTVRAKRIGLQQDLPRLGEAWQRAFPSRKQVPLTHIDETTVYAEIHTPCPLRGTTDVHACWRMMEFDRRVVEEAGGQFVVLRSQAEPGVTVCQVAMRFRGQAADDLVPAHRRAAEGGPTGSPGKEPGPTPA